MITLDSIERDRWPEALRPFAESAKRQVDINLAAVQLARRRPNAKARRRQRIYTGVVDGRRAWRHMQVILTDGRIAELFMARRGAAVVTWVDEFAVRPNKIGACRTDEVRRYKLPAAVALGVCKRGVKEHQSAKKAKAARINGCAPPRPGSRPRGRPRSSQPAEAAVTESGC